MDFPVVDLTLPSGASGHVGELAGQKADYVGSVNGAEVASSIEELRAELSDAIKSDGGSGLRLTELIVKLTITAEGKVAFVAKGSVGASVEAKFNWSA